MRVVSFDVWGTLLRIDLMLERIEAEVSRLSGLEAGVVRSAFRSARKRAKDMRLRGELLPMEAVDVCQGLFASELGVDVEVIKRACARVVAFADESLLVPGAVEALRLAKDRCRVACLGNVQFWPSSQTRVMMERLGLSDYIDRHFFSDETGVFKPDRGAFMKVAEHFGVEPSEMLHVGDRELEDFKGATDAGLSALLVDPSRPLDEQLREFLAG